MAKIPVIDFSKLNGEKRNEAMKEIANACEEWGFFQLVNHGINIELLNKVKKMSSECYRMERAALFNKSNPVKMLDEAVKNGNRKKKLDDFDWEDVFYLQDGEEWPTNLPEFKETMKEYRKELKKLAEKITEVMDENLGLEKGYMKRAFGGTDEPYFGTKVSHYPPCPQPDMVNGLRAHTDAGGVILLFQDDEVDGLQILKDGEWIDVQPMANTIVINTGDQIEVLSNGRYKSVWHRVLAKPDGNRSSIASFYNPSFSAIIEPAVPVEGAAYPKFLFRDYMAVYSEHKFSHKEPRFQAVSAM